MIGTFSNVAFSWPQLDVSSSNTMNVGGVVGGGGRVADADKLELKFELEGVDGTIQ